MKVSSFEVFYNKIELKILCTIAIYEILNWSEKERQAGSDFNASHQVKRNATLLDCCQKGSKKIGL